MKSLSGIVLCFFLSLPFSMMLGQKTDSSKVDDDELGKKIGIEVDRFIDHLDEHLKLRWDHQAWDDNESQEEDTASLGETGGTTIHYTGSTVIGAADTIRSSIQVDSGNLTVNGVVYGNVLIRNGSLYVKDHGRIEGNARVVNGNLVKDEGGIVEGIEQNMKRRAHRFRLPRKYIERSKTTFDVPWLTEQENVDKFVFTYNRVEGLFLGLGSEKKFYWDGRNNWNAYGFGGWGFKSHTWRGELGLDRQFTLLLGENINIIEIGVEGYSLTDTKDQSIISLHENTAAALLIHEDFRDYFEREGYSFHAAQYTKKDYFKGEVKISYLVDTYNSLSNNVDWAWFGGGKWFRQNPAIDPGDMRSILADVGISTVTKMGNGSSEGWDLFVSAEVSDKNLGSAFGFDQYIADIRRFQPIDHYESFNIRLRAGSSDGSLPLQKTFELGGLGTMNAFPFKSESGNRMLLINAEYIINGRFLDDLDFWPTWLFKHLNFIVLSDAGFTRSPAATTASGFDDIGWSEFKHDFGFALGNRSGSFRIGVAWRTDTKEPAQFILRFNRPF